MDRPKKKCKPKAKAKKKCSKALKSAVDDYGIPKPKRFLTAYNFFFMRERAAVLSAKQDEDSSTKTEADKMFSTATDDGAAKPWTKKKKRLHVKTHGKIEFQSLSKLVASKWKALTPDERKVFDDLAKEDLARFQRENGEYKEKVRMLEEKAEQQKADRETSTTASNVEENVQSKLHHDTELKDEVMAPDQERSVSQSDLVSRVSATNDKSSDQNARGKERVSDPVGRCNLRDQVIIPTQQVSASWPLYSRTTEGIVKKNENLPSYGKVETVMSAAWPMDECEKSAKERSASENRHYNCAKEVEKILPTTLADHDTVSRKVGGEEKTFPFNFQTSKLHGRDQHVSTIMDAYERLVQSKSSSEMVMVSGYSGAGKSTLVHHVQKLITDTNGRFLCGKFDLFRQMEPLSAIIHALTQFCSILVQDAESDHHQQLELAVQEIVGSETDILADVIPNFRQAFQMPTSSNVSVGAKEAQYRLKYAFRRFFRAITPPDQPLVLFLDDLQWADLLSLDLIESLITDAENKSLFLIGSYRSNEVNDSHPLATRLRTMERKGVTITTVKVGNLSRECVNELISDILHNSPPVTQSLSTAVYRKTNGNVMFVLQFLKSIYDEGLLHFQFNSKQWQWDTSMIESKKIADNAVELMLRKIMQFPVETQHALKVMACIGSDCETWILESILVRDGKDNAGCTGLIAQLKLAVKEGLVDFTGSSYKFAHDHINHAAYSLIPENERSNLHLSIGSKVWANKAAPPEKALFIAVGQFNKGAMLITDSYQRFQVARLNLQAGEKSMSLTAFVPAAFYLKVGISLLDERSWVDHYDLCLKLHSLYAEAKYCSGEFEEMNGILAEIFTHAKCHLDTLGAYFTSFSALIAQCKAHEAMNLGLQILSQLGEPLPTHSDKKMVLMVELAKAKELLQGKTDAELLALKKMNDENKIAAVRVMNRLALACFFADQDMYALLILRVVQTSLHYGICNESALGFAAYGSLMIHVFEDIKDAYRFGQLSLRFLEMSQAKECLPGIYVVVYCMINPLVEQNWKNMRSLEHAYKVGMQCGNCNYAMTALAQHCILSFCCGENLKTTEKRMRKCENEMEEHKQEMFRSMVLPYRQACLNLMGESDDPEQLNGDVMNQEELLKNIRESRRINLVAVVYHIRSWLAYLFGNYESAARLAKERQNTVPLPRTFSRCRYFFVEGLIAYALAHKSEQTEWSMLANKSTEELEKYAAYAPFNYQHMRLLLQAESAFLVRKCDEAVLYYDKAIEIAGENGYVHDQALACERAGVFYSAQGNSDMASGYYHQAHSAYLKWGAYCKADHVRQKYSF